MRKTRIQKKMISVISVFFLSMTVSPIAAKAGEIQGDGVSPYVILINRDHPLEKDYVPPNLVTISDQVRSTKTVIQMEEEAAAQFIAMIGRMNEDGISDIYASSGYRSYIYQKQLHTNKVNQYKAQYDDLLAEELAGRIVAKPGQSEHQTGLAIDVTAKSIGYALNTNFDKTDAYRWLAEHCHEYGFILRYPEDKTEITNIIYEPWHLRYVGQAAAAYITRNGLCLEEYVEQTTFFENTIIQI